MTPQAIGSRAMCPTCASLIRETRQQVQGPPGAIRDSSGANNPHRFDIWTKPRPQHILTGKLFCGSCGGVFGNSGRDYLACDAAKSRRSVTTTAPSAGGCSRISCWMRCAPG